MGRASLSAVIVAHDSLHELRKSLPPLLAQLSGDDELIVVDNASSDGLATELRQLAPRARLLSLGRNVGFAAGANRGVEAARGELIVLLNPDAVVQPGWADAIRAPWDGPWAAWMGLVLLDGGEQINTSGGVLHFTGFGWAGQVGEPRDAAPQQPTDIGFLSGACLAIPRLRWNALGGFPEHFFMYCEDVDLSLRLRLMGERLAVIPDAVVEHAYEFAKGQLKWRLLERNRWATIIRTYPTALLVAVLPALMVSEAAVWLVALRGGWADMKGRASLDLAQALPRLLRERRQIQSSARIAPDLFAGPMTAQLSSPHLVRAGARPVVSTALAVYWRVVYGLLSRWSRRRRTIHRRYAGS
jgi:GT2 family glycosyltransferase